MVHTAVKGTGEETELIRRGYNSGDEFSVRVSGGFVIIETPYLDKPAKISLTQIDDLADELGVEKNTAYFIKPDV